MFIIPEILWSPVINVTLGFLQMLQGSNHVVEFRSNFLFNSDKTDLLLLCLVFQLAGLIGVISLIYKTGFSLLVKSILIPFLLTVSLAVCFSLYLTFALRNCCGF